MSLPASSDDTRSIKNACITLIGALKCPPPPDLALDKSLEQALVAEIASWNLDLENDPTHTLMMRFAAAVPDVSVYELLNLMGVACSSFELSQLLFKNHPFKAKLHIGTIIW